MSGEPGQPRAKSRLRYDINGRNFEMIETVLARNLPDEFSGTYEMTGMLNHITNRFYEVDSQSTRWVAENNVQFNGIMRIMGLFMGGSFRKNGRKMMENFKQFAESTK